VGPFLEVDEECLGSDFDVCRRVDGISEQMTGLDRLVTVADPLAKLAARERPEGDGIVECLYGRIRDRVLAQPERYAFRPVRVAVPLAQR
jgi:hypothetical protein